MQLTLIKELNIQNDIGRVLKCMYKRSVSKDEDGMTQFHFKKISHELMTVADFRKAHDYHHVLSLDAARNPDNPRD